MLPLERQNKIKALILEHHHLRISDLSEQFNVSEMTIHRDLKPLVEEGLVKKTFGGVSINEDRQTKWTNQEECVLCQSRPDERFSFRIFLANNKIEVACCAHCGLLRTNQLGNDVIQAICHDFLRHTTISAPLAWYVMDTSVNVGCCTPQVLTFEWKEHAKKFVKGFGGFVYSFDEAIEAVNYKMSQRENNHS